MCIKYSLCAAFFIFACKCHAYDIKPVSQPDSIIKKTSITLVFVPLNYASGADLKLDIEALIRKLKETKPFDEFINEIGVFKAVLSKGEAERCLKFQEGGLPLKADAGFLKSVYKKVRADYKLIVLDNTGTDLRAEFSSPEASSLVIIGRARFKDRSGLAKAFLHELGHSLGLRDESPQGYAKTCSPGYPNCAVTIEEARKWWGDLVGKPGYADYIKGCCGNSDYIRPTIASLMNDINKAEDFGPVNERYLRQILRHRQESAYAFRHD
jgi:hypothetical protein